MSLDVQAASLLDDFAPGLRLLRVYDDGSVSVPDGTSPTFVVTTDEARKAIDYVRAAFPSDTVFGLDPENRLADTLGPCTRSTTGTLFLRVCSTGRQIFCTSS